VSQESKISTAAQSLVLSSHTYAHRASDIATHLARAQIVAKPSPGDVDSSGSNPCESD